MPGNNPTGKGGWKKGQSGNPTGIKGRHVGDLAKEAREYAGLALDTLVAICRTGTERGRLVAAQVLLDRGFGKAPQPIDATIMAKKFSELSDAELASIEARLIASQSAGVLSGAVNGT